MKKDLGVDQEGPFLVYPNKPCSFPIPMREQNMSDTTKLDDKLKNALDDYETSVADFLEDPRTEYVMKGNRKRVEDRVRELEADAYSRGTYDTQMRYAGTD